MKTRTTLFVALCAAILFTGFDASARVRRYHRHRISYRPPARPPAPPRPAAPKILQVSGTLYSLNGPGRSLMIRDDNTKSQLRLVITPQTKFIRDGQQVQPTSIKAYEHVAVTYQDTDATAKEVKVTPLAGTSAPATKPKANQAPKKKT